MQRKQYTCAGCGETYVRYYTQRKYCHACAQARQAARVAASNERKRQERDGTAQRKPKRKCWQCGDQQIRNRGPRWFCSDECRERYERFERHCEENGGWLSPHTNHGLTRLGVELRVAEAEAREDAADAEWAALHYGARGAK
jgi:hypothetical protein